MSHSVDANKKRLSSLIRVHMFKINNASRIPGVIDKQLADGIIISYCTTVPDSAQNVTSVLNLDFDDGHKPTLINNIFILNKKASGKHCSNIYVYSCYYCQQVKLFCFYFFFATLSLFFLLLCFQNVFKKNLIDWFWLVLNISLCTFNFAINEMLKNYNNNCSIN